MSILKPLFNTNCHKTFADTPTGTEQQYCDFHCRNCFEVYHLIKFFDEISLLEHAILLTEGDGTSEQL